MSVGLSQHHAEAGHAFLAYHADLDAMVGLARADDGDETAFDEMDVGDRRTRPFEDLTGLDLDQLKRRLQEVEIHYRQPGKEPIPRAGEG